METGNKLRQRRCVWARKASKGRQALGGRTSRTLHMNDVNDATRQRAANAAASQWDFSSRNNSNINNNDLYCLTVILDPMVVRNVDNVLNIISAYLVSSSSSYSYYYYYYYRTAFTDTGLLNGFVFSFSINHLVWFVQ